MLMRILLVVCFAAGMSFCADDREDVARRRALFPGLVIHGSGHFYAGDFFGGTELLALEGMGFLCLSRANADLPDKLGWLSEKKEYWTYAWYAAGSYLLFVSWLHDFLDAPRIIEGSGFHSRGEKSHFLKMSRSKRFKSCLKSFAATAVMGYFNLQPEATVAGGLGIVYFFDWLFWEERFYVSDEKEALNFRIYNSVMGNTPVMGLSCRF